MRVGRHVLTELELTLPALLYNTAPLSNCGVKRGEMFAVKEDFLRKIKRSVSLQEYNTMRINSVADFFLRVNSADEVVEGLNYARENKIPFFVLGGGSNVILPPRYKGLILFLGADNFVVNSEKDVVVLMAQAGAYLPDVSLRVTKEQGKGLEWAGGVPGTMGGAVRGNAGAFDDFTADYVKSVEAVDTEILQKKVFDREDCRFGYRESIFKKGKRYVVVNVEMEFPKGSDGLQKLEEYLLYRAEKHPTEPSSGSVFKNPRVSEDFYVRYPETVKFKELGFIPARFLIEDCGLKGRRIGGAQIAEKHANFIINTGGATGEDIKALINTVKAEVKEKYGVAMEEEVEVVKEH